MTRLVITGRIPSKKNSKQIVCRGRRPILLSSEAYDAWHLVASNQIQKQKPPKGIKLCRIEATFYPPDNRKADLSNKWESIGDLLVDNGVLVDDNWFVILKLELLAAYVDKVNPRVEIVIHHKL